MIGTGAFQETDIFGMTLPIVKHSYLITDINDIPRIVKEAFYIAQTGRPGPVVIDVPKNVQQARTQPVFPTLERDQKRPARLQPARPARRRPGAERNHRPDREGRAPGALLRRRHHHQRRGGGTASKFAEATQDSGDDHAHGHAAAFPETHPLSLRWLGMHGAAFANWAVNGEYEHAQDLHRPDGEDQGRRGFAAGVRRAVRRPRDRQVREVLRARHDRPPGH